ncbi:MAG: hypothetical protein AB9872_11830 [Solidesulfovibrio sp.]
MNFLKMLLVFAPWLAFLFIAQGSIVRLKIGLLVALVLCVVMGVARVHRGILLWAGLLFFSYASVAVILFNHFWTERYMGVLACGVLAVSVWVSLLIKKPFTLDYAREHVSKSLWNDPNFIRTNVLITALWGTVFTVNVFLAWGKLVRFAFPAVAYEVVSYGLLFGTMAFSTWYPNYIRQKRRAGK